MVRRPEGEPNYHIFYQLLSGADSDLRRTLGLENLSEPNLFMTPLQRVSGGGGGRDSNGSSSSGISCSCSNGSVVNGCLSDIE